MRRILHTFGNVMLLTMDELWGVNCWTAQQVRVVSPKLRLAPEIRGANLSVLVMYDVHANIWRICEILCIHFILKECFLKCEYNERFSLFRT